jgi:hypothetical protein
MLIAFKANKSSSIALFIPKENINEIAFVSLPLVVANDYERFAIVFNQAS